MTKALLLAVVAVAAFIVNPSFGCYPPDPTYHYDAADMRIAIEGTWKLHLVGKPAVMLKVRQAARIEHQAMRATFVSSASACGTRSFVRTAGACMDISEMPLEVEVAGMTTKHKPTGEFIVPYTTFEIGNLDIQLDDLAIHAQITPTGTVDDVRVSRRGDNLLASLVRVR